MVPHQLSESLQIVWRKKVKNVFVYIDPTVVVYLHEKWGRLSMVQSWKRSLWAMSKKRQYWYKIIWRSSRIRGSRKLLSPSLTLSKFWNVHEARHTAYWIESLSQFWGWWWIKKGFWNVMQIYVLFFILFYNIKRGGMLYNNNIIWKFTFVKQLWTQPHRIQRYIILNSQQLIGLSCTINTVNKDDSDLVNKLCCQIYRVFHKSWGHFDFEYLENY